MARLIKRNFPLEENNYFRAVTFLYGTPEQIKTELAGYKLDYGNQSGRYLVKITNDGFHHDFICVARHSDKIRELAVLSHEILHYVIFTMKRAGLKLGDKSEEAYTYHFEWMLRKCLKAMRGKK